MIKALSLHPSLKTPVEAKRLEAAPRRDGELEEVLQPRLPSPAQRTELCGKLGDGVRKAA